jgi:hypothetical protein
MGNKNVIYRCQKFIERMVFFETCKEQEMVGNE